MSRARIDWPAELTRAASDGTCSADLARQLGVTKVAVRRAVLRVGIPLRRLTSQETVRLQGFPDDHTAIPYRGRPAADGPQYKSHGNSMAVPVVRYIMERMHMHMTAAGEVPR